MQKNHENIVNQFTIMQAELLLKLSERDLLIESLISEKSSKISTLGNNLDSSSVLAYTEPTLMLLCFLLFCISANYVLMFSHSIIFDVLMMPIAAYPILSKYDLSPICKVILRDMLKYLTPTEILNRFDCKDSFGTEIKLILNRVTNTYDLYIMGANDTVFTYVDNIAMLSQLQ